MERTDAGDNVSRRDEVVEEDTCKRANKAFSATIGDNDMGMVSSSSTALAVAVVVVVAMEFASTLTIRRTEETISDDDEEEDDDDDDEEEERERDGGAFDTGEPNGESNDVKRMEAR